MTQTPDLPSYRPAEHRDHPPADWVRDDRAQAAEINEYVLQREIDARETARAEALLQVCRWAATSDDPLDPGDHYATVRILQAIQHDLIPTKTEQRWTVQHALAHLARHWRALPVDGRAVVLAGILPPGFEDSWETLVRSCAQPGGSPSGRLLGPLVEAVVSQ